MAPRSVDACVAKLELLVAEALRMGLDNKARTLRRALRELRKCDRELRTVADLISIKGIGAGIAGELIGTVEAVANGTFHAPDDIFSISKWLADLGLSQYDATGYDNAFIIENLTEDDLNTLGIEKPGHRRTLLLKAKQMAAGGVGAAPLAEGHVAREGAVQGGAATGGAAAAGAGDQAAAEAGVGKKRTRPNANTPTASRKKQKTTENGGAGGAPASPPAKKKREYIPRYRSGAWAILMAFAQSAARQIGAGSPGAYEGMGTFRKQELIDAAAPFCDTAMEKSGDSNYSGWSSMKTLANDERSNRTQETVTTSQKKTAESRRRSQTSAVSSMQTPPPRRNPLSTISGASDRGSGRDERSIDLSQGVRERSAPLDLEVDVDMPSIPAAHRAVVRHSPAKLVASATARIILLIDLREELKKNRVRRAHLEGRITQSQSVCKSAMDYCVQLANKDDFAVESRVLEVGDCQWVLEVQTPQRKYEYVLNCIVERKTLDDLEMFRLRRSPIDRVIFVIEGKQESLTARAKVAMAELQTQGAQVMLVNTLRDFSMALIHLTDNLKRKLAVTLQSLKDSPQVPPPVRLSDGAMVVCDSGVPMTWRAFEQDASKSMNLSATDVWGKQLLQLHGVSPPKARVIATVFPTPMALREYVQRQLRRMTREDCMVELRAKLRNNEVSVGPSIAAMLVSIVLGMDDV